MPKRPPQGRGSGGRVTPSPKQSDADVSGGSSAKGKTKDGQGAGKAKDSGTAKDVAKTKGVAKSKDVGAEDVGSSRAKTPDRSGAAGPAAEPTGDASSRKTRARVPQASAAAQAKQAKQAKRSGSGSGSGSGSASRRDRDRDAVVVADAVDKPTGWRALLGSPDPDYVKPKDRPRPWWGMGDVGLWFLISQIAAGVAYYVVAVAGHYDLNWPIGDGARLGEVVGRIGIGQAPSITKTIADMPLTLTTALQMPLWIGFIGGPIYVAWRKGTSIVKDFGFSMQWRDVPLGLAVGVFTQLAVVWVIYKVLFIFIGDQDVSAAARQLTDKASSPLEILLLFGIVAVGAPVAEELFFRGLSQRAFAKRIGPLWALPVSAVFFAFAHGQVLQFPALVVFGLILGWMANHYGRLGPSIWAHIGFNTVTAVTLIWNLNLP